MLFYLLNRGWIRVYKKKSIRENQSKKIFKKMAAFYYYFFFSIFLSSKSLLLLIGINWRVVKSDQKDTKEISLKFYQKLYTPEIENDALVIE